MEYEDRQLVLGALDSLAIALTGYDHVWTNGEREIYEQAVDILKMEPLSNEIINKAIGTEQQRLSPWLRHGSSCKEGHLKMEDGGLVKSVECECGLSEALKKIYP